jgi:pre-rRNA-processing protein TSR3
MREDDPKKCTAAKLCRLGLAQEIYASKIPHSAIVLNPFAETPLMALDRKAISRYGIVAIDCSWEKVDPAKFKYHGCDRRLPILLAANPTNYAKHSKLSSAEALAAALYLTGFEEEAIKILSPFRWGHTFWSLNRDPLRSFRHASSLNELLRLEKEYF